MPEDVRAWAAERVIAGEFVLVEPALAPEANPNKQWGEARWVELVERIAGDMPVYQTLMLDRVALPKAIGVATPSFLHAVAIMELALFSILPEGGLHHAAAARGRPAVVLFGGCNSPEFTGYGAHVNLADTGPGSPCGFWEPCEHCAGAWDRLTVEEVSGAGIRCLARIRNG